MSKLGVQVLSWVPGTLEYVLQARPQHLKVLVADPVALATIKREIPDCLIVYRRYCDLGTQQRLLEQPERGAREFASAVLADIERARPFVDLAEGLNETGLWESADAYSLWTAEYARQMHAEGLKVGTYCFSTGTPPGYFNGDGNLYPDEFREGLRAYWAHYLDGLRESDYLGLHEYSWPQMQNSQSWLCLRYRRVWDILPEDCRKPILITECGIDGGVIGRTVEESGWRAFCSEGQYLEQLKWYASELEKDPYILGAHIYHCGSADPRWDSFDVRGCDQIASYIRNQKREEPTTMSLAEQFPEVFQAWNDAGGDPEESFRTYLQATGRIAVTPADYQQLGERIKAHVSELTAIGLMLPK